jgi:hypothetical protein
MYTVTITKYMFWRKRYNNKQFLPAAKHVPQTSKVLHSGWSSQGNVTWQWAGWHAVKILARVRDLSLLKNVHGIYGAHPASQWVCGSPLPQVKWLGCETDYSTASSTEVNEEWNYTTTSPLYLHGTLRDNFTSFIGWCSAPLYSHMN